MGISLRSRKQTPLERFLDTAKAAGCPRDQIENYLKGGVVLSPKQLRVSALARECDLPGGPTKIGYGGAMGGGKSAWSIIQTCVDDCQRCPGLKVLLLRKVGKANKENFNDLRLRLLMSIAHRYSRVEGILNFENGSRIILGHYQNESDIDAYLGLEYDVILIEEATTIGHAKVKAIETRLRTSKADWRPRMYLTFNPGGIGHTWVKKLLVDPYKRGRETDTRFVPATVDDNPFINAEYRDVLEGLTGWRYRAWRKGDWDINAGQFFSNWRDTAHVIKGFTCPSSWDAWAALDYGFTHLTTFGLFRKDGDGNVFMTDEYGANKTAVSHHAQTIKGILTRRGLTVEKLQTFVAGADVWAKRDEGPTIADKYQEEEITFSKAHDDRVAGCGEILSRLGEVDPEPGRLVIDPTFFIFENCVRTIEQIPAMVHNPNRPEDVLKVDVDDDGEGGDDFFDMTRYGLMEAPFKPPITRKPQDTHVTILKPNIPVQSTVTTPGALLKDGRLMVPTGGSPGKKAWKGW